MLFFLKFGLLPQGHCFFFTPPPIFWRKRRGDNFLEKLEGGVKILIGQGWRKRGWRKSFGSVRMRACRNKEMAKKAGAVKGVAKKWGGEKGGGDNF